MGKSVPQLTVTAPKKSAAGLYGSIYSAPNAGRFKNRFYTLGDSSQGIDTLSRELLVRWSREMTAQLPFVPAAIKALAEFSIGNTYKPVYTGENKEWWTVAEKWLTEEWFPNCCTRGNQYDFQTCLNLESQLIDTDGDYLLIFGEEDGLPKFQIIQNNRLGSQHQDNSVILEGKYKDCILSDGVYYTAQGKPVAYNIKNAGNLVNNAIKHTADLVVSAADATLVFDAKYIDKCRGIPSIGSAILQAISVQELDSYLMEKIKIQSTIALVERTPSGEAPQELQNTLEALNQLGSDNGSYNIAANTHAVDIVQGSQIRYVHAEGGDIKTLSGDGPGTETSDYIARLETQILSTIGVPHQIIYSTDKTSGRITTGVAEMFRSAIAHRQKIMDKTAKLRVGWALSKAQDLGLIPRNDQENLTKIIEFTHPKLFTLDAKYDSQIVINQYEAGFSSLNDATTQLYNKSAAQTIAEQANEQIEFYKKAQEVEKATGIELNTIISNWRLNTTPRLSPPSQD